MIDDLAQHFSQQIKIRNFLLFRKTNSVTKHLKQTCRLESGCEEFFNGREWLKLPFANFGGCWWSITNDLKDENEKKKHLKFKIKLFVFILFLK
jgi:hypothetical protein